MIEKNEVKKELTKIEEKNKEMQYMLQARESEFHARESKLHNMESELHSRESALKEKEHELMKMKSELIKLKSQRLNNNRIFTCKKTIRKSCPKKIITNGYHQV